MISMNFLLDKYMGFVEESLMFDEVPDNILPFEEFASSHYGISSAEAADWYYGQLN